jgi:peptidoglycan hydrolase-like protein with peptidoglycan-binding domain
MIWRPIASLALASALSFCAAAPSRAAQSSTSSPSSKSQKHKAKHHSKRQPSQKAPTPDRITEIQSALAKGGYFQGQPNGKWDSSTVAAVQKFQSANGIDANGKLDAPTLQKLGLGSDIAGVSAPKPVPPPSCCSMTPSTPPSTAPSTQTSTPPAASSTPPVSEQASQH